MKKNFDLNKLCDSLAYLICNIIKTDGSISEKERKKFDDFFIKEFGLDKEDVEVLFKKAINDTNYDEHISFLKEAFIDNPIQKAKFMKYLNEIIYSDGIKDGEYELFEKIRAELF